MPRRWIPVLVLLALALPAAALGQWSVATLGAQGELIEVRIGAYGDLFPEGTHGVASANRVMAVDVTPIEGDAERLLVPGTEGPERENRPSLVHDSGQLFLLWGSMVADGLSSLHLVGFDGEVWTEPIEISGDPRRLKGPARLALTRDSYGAEALGVSRTTVHLLWWEEDVFDPNQVEVFYTPVVFVAGEYLGWNPVISLDRYDQNEALGSFVDVTELGRAANIERGSDQRSVVVALPQSHTGRLLTMSIRLLPVVLQELADEARGHIVLIGRIGSRDLSTTALAGGIRDLVDAFSGSLHAGVRSYIAQRVYQAILAFGNTYDAEQLPEIAQQVWDTILSEGASILGNSLRSSDLECDMAVLGPSASEPSPELHQIELCVASDRVLPETDPTALHAIHVSEDGSDVLVAWLDHQGELHYRLSEAESWTEAITVKTQGVISIHQALEILKARVRLDGGSL